MLGLECVASPPPLTLILTTSPPTPVDLRIIPHCSKNGSLTTKEVAGGWVEVEVKWGEVSCIYWDLELEMEVEI